MIQKNIPQFIASLNIAIKTTKETNLTRRTNRKKRTNILKYNKIITQNKNM